MALTRQQREGEEWIESSRSKKQKTVDEKLSQMKELSEQKQLEEGVTLQSTLYLSTPSTEDDLQTQLMNFQKYCTVNKMKDETRQKLDKLESEKRTFMADYEKKRKALWRNFYKFKDAGNELENKLDTKQTSVDADLERKIRLEVLGDLTDVN